MPFQGQFARRGVAVLLPIALIIEDLRLVDTKWLEANMPLMQCVTNRNSNTFGAGVVLPLADGIRWFSSERKFNLTIVAGA